MLPATGSYSAPPGRIARRLGDKSHVAHATSNLRSERAKRVAQCRTTTPTGLYKNEASGGLRQLRSAFATKISALPPARFVASPMARQNLWLRLRPHSRPHGLLGSEDDLRGDLLAVVRHGIGLGLLLDLAAHEARDLAQLRQAIGAPRDGALGLAGAAQRVADDFLGVVAAEDLDQVILHAEGEGVVSQIGNLIRALVAEEGPVGQGEVLNVHWRGDDAAGDVQTLADVALHLRAEDGRGLKSRDHVRDLGVVVGDEGLVAEAGDLLAEPLLIVLAEGARAHDLDAHLPCQHPGHAGRVRGVAEDHGPLVG
mmetsp:Transcript_72682/g.204847  ORF Transcript_72682/g.204847 Transcript_72682/m.204847 type:complete len:312 (-) Transcript_72682:303-1238(-)